MRLQCSGRGEGCGGAGIVSGAHGGAASRRASTVLARVSAQNCSLSKKKKRKKKKVCPPLCLLHLVTRPPPLPADPNPPPGVLPLRTRARKRALPRTHTHAHRHANTRAPIAARTFPPADSPSPSLARSPPTPSLARAQTHARTRVYALSEGKLLSSPRLDRSSTLQEMNLVLWFFYKLLRAIQIP